MNHNVYSTLAEFEPENRALGTNLPTHADRTVFSQPISVGAGKKAPNRLACQAMEGCDGTADGAPDALTLRRYDRFARGGAGTIWFEATACCEQARANPRQLWLHEKNADAFRRAVEAIRTAALQEHGHEVLLILQATHSGRYSKPNGVPEPIIAYNNPLFEGNNPLPRERIISDDDLDRTGEALIRTARLAQEVGFDGVDIKACHRYLNSELLSAYHRSGRYGGSYENRTRLLRETVAGAKAACGGNFLVTSRLNVYDGFPYPYGFGVSPEGGLEFDPAEPIRLVRDLRDLGVSLLNITMGNPYVNPHVNRPFALGGYEAPEHPLVGVARMLHGTAALKRAVPEMKFIASGWSFLGAAAPAVASGFFHEGGFDLAGFGRTAFAYPQFAKDLMETGELKRENLCLCCSKCSEIMRAGSTPGCVIRDKDVYLPLYREVLKGRDKK